MAASNIKSRKATTRQLEIQLKATLKELQAAKTLNDHLLREREDCEEEQKKILAKNTVLRNDFVEYDYKLLDSQDKVDQLQNLVDNFNQCASTHEVALNRIINLEDELGAANEDLNYLRRERECYDSSITQNLYQEMLNNKDNKDSNIKNLIFFNSNNKLKKYVNINKYIRRTQKLIKSQRCIKNYSKMKLELSVMKNTVQKCNEKLDSNMTEHDLSVQRLNAELSRLRNKLEDMSLKYSTAQSEIKEHMLAFTQ